MFLLYINDIAAGVSSSLCLFADDYLLYRTIKSIEDSIILQRDIKIVVNGPLSGKCVQMHSD